MPSAIHNCFFNAHFQSPTHRLNMAKIENSISQMRQVEASRDLLHKILAIIRHLLTESHHWEMLGNCLIN